jgi:hypothetical protein
MRKIIILAATVALFGITSGTAQARWRHHRHHAYHSVYSYHGGRVHVEAQGPMNLFEALFGGFGATRTSWQPEPVVPLSGRRARSRGIDRSVQSMIADRVSARLGSQWVATALRIARIESGGRCNAYNRGAIGVFQVRNPSRFGVSARYAMTCAGGIEAGISHMQSCLAKGARTSGQMMVCHNTGNPFSRRVDRAYRFATRY